MNEVESLLESLGCRYTIRTRRKLKRMNLSINGYGCVQLMLPPRYPKRHAFEFVQTHLPWLKDQLDALAYQKRHWPEKYEELPREIHLRALAKSWQVSYQSLDAARSRIKQHNTTLSVISPDEITAQRTLQRWLRRQAKSLFQQQLDSLCLATSMRYEKLSVRRQRTRWGSCSSHGHISLNQNALFLPYRWVRYLCLHELCHTVHMNHSKRFWQLVSRFEPDYKIIDKQINTHQHYVPLWAVVDVY